MWKNDLVSAIQSNRVLETSIEPELINQNWTTIINMIDSHPKDLIKYEDKKNRTELQQLHRRETVKPIVKEIISLLRKLFS